MSVPFAASRYDLGPAGLEPLDAAGIPVLAAAIAAIDPWASIPYPAADLAAYLGRSDAATAKFAVVRDGMTVGAVAVRYPFLRGPYLELLALLPPTQRLGIGTAVIAWMESEVAGRAHNLWVCVSDFNEAARRFYERNGFALAAPLHDLAFEGRTELFLRKRL